MLPVEADVQRRRRVRERTHGDVVHPAGGDRLDRCPGRSPPDASTCAPRRSARRTASAVSARDMLSTRTRSAPAARASSSWSRSSTSTSTRQAPGRPAARRAASTAGPTPPRAAMWLSFTSTASERLMRWFAPPPQRTAYFSTARSPGRVLRVSLTTAPRTGHGADHGRRGSGDPGQVGDEVEDGALGGQERVGRAAQLGDHGAGAGPGPRRRRAAWPAPARCPGGG